MLKSKITLLAAASLLCAGMATAQTVDAQKHGDMQRHFDPAALHRAACEDHQARAAARLTYVEVKLGLTEAQKPLFAKWRQAVLDGAAKEKTTCLEGTPKGEAMPTVLEREAHEEAMLSARLQLLQGTRPALQAFYDSLTPAQKASFDHMRHRRMQHGFMRHPD